MKQNTKRVLSLLTVLSLLLGFLVSCGSKATATTMHLKRTEGTVGVSDGAGKNLEPAENLGLYSDYGVDTKGASYAWIDLDEVKLTKMDENSQVEIKKEDKHLTIEVKSGSLFFNITEPLAEDETLDIRTSTMLVGIRGTCGWVEVPDGEHMNVYLLEGKVECTAGENTATVNAGEMAEMRADGVIEVSAFPGSAVPAFVREEIEDDENLMEVILDASGIDVTGGGASSGNLDDYADILSEITAHGEKILYTEILDFEADGKPELLAIVNHNANGIPDNDYIMVHICRKDMQIMSISASSYNTNGIGITSLVEKGGRLFVRSQRTQTFPTSPGVFSTETVYAGSVAQEEGSMEDWGWVDQFTCSEREYGIYYPHDERGFTSVNYEELSAGELAAAQAQYKELKVLVYYTSDGGYIVLPDPSQIEAVTQLAVTEPEPEEPQLGNDQPAEAAPAGEDITPAAADTTTAAEDPAPTVEDTTTADEDAGQADQPSDADILEQYKAILAQGKSYTYRSDADLHANGGYAKYITYKYTLYQESGYSVPTLILENSGVDLIGYLLFRYDPATGTTSQVGDDMVSRFEEPSHSFLSYSVIPWDNWHDITDTSYLESWLS